jgi:hypothetical protein
VGRQNNAPFLLVWANSPEMDSSLRKGFTIKWPVGDFSIFKLSEELERDSDSIKIYSCMLKPPRGIDH